MRYFLALTLLAAPLLAQTKSDDAFLNALYAVRTYHAVAISPDGARIAWAEKEHGIWTANTDGSNRKQLTTGDDEGLAWSPDGKTLAYLWEKNGQKQLYAGATRLTQVKGFLAEPRWAPDGKSIAFLFIENAGRAAGPLVAMSRAVGVIQSHPDEQRIAIVDVATKKMRIVTPGDMYVYHYDWAPDSTRIVAEAVKGPGDDNYWVAQLHVVDVAAATMKAIYKPEYQIANPRWSPDGAHIAFIEGLMSDEGLTGGDLFIVNADGSGRRNLTPNLKASVTAIEWLSADALFAGEVVAGEAAMMRINLDGASNAMWRGSSNNSDGDTIVGASIARGGAKSAVIHSGFRHAPEVWAGTTGEWKQVTHANDNVKTTWGDAKSIKWRNGNYDVDGWLLAPSNVEAARKYPMIVWIHGGPAHAALNKWPREEAALLSTKGYYVFYPNFRGSYGQGEAFTRANVKDFGHGDLSDILSGVDEVVRTEPVDAKRLAIWGWSYGGFMTMWTVTQTDRFATAVAGAGIANWQSYYGQNDIDAWMIPYFGASVYDDPAVYARSAPITYIKNVRTPTLVVVGERDGECPAPQSFEFWHALKTLGVETQLVVYPDEGHAFRDPEHKRDLARRLVQWFDEHLR
jgi:dipeptidyl aminopeptidase/acylaminoacyl peptidase